MREFLYDKVYSPGAPKWRAWAIIAALFFVILFITKSITIPFLGEIPGSIVPFAGISFLYYRLVRWVQKIPGSKKA